jgi:hypothetical protein
MFLVIAKNVLMMRVPKLAIGATDTIVTAANKEGNVCRFFVLLSVTLCLLSVAIDSNYDCCSNNLKIMLYDANEGENFQNAVQRAALKLNPNSSITWLSIPLQLAHLASTTNTVRNSMGKLPPCLKPQLDADNNTIITVVRSDNAV